MKCMPMKLKVRIFEGKSPELYLAVGHFVLSPAYLRENNNYPYKSSRMFTWHVLYHEDQVVAFMPVERKLDGGYKIDNYYATPDRERGNQLLKLLKSVIKESGDETSPLRATVQKRDAGKVNRDVLAHPHKRLRNKQGEDDHGDRQTQEHIFGEESFEFL